MRTIAQRDLRNDSAGILRAVEAGETFLVTRNGQPVAQLGPVTQRRRQVPRAELESVFAGASPIEFATFRQDIDQILDQDLE